jgi:hypothetical protein
MVIESILMAAPAIGLAVAAVAAIGIGYMWASCAVARIQGKACT